MPETDRKPALVGFGNPLWGDDGIGLAIVDHLRSDPALCEKVEFFDLGTSAARLLHLLPGRPKVVLVDAALMGLPPGTLRRFVPEEARNRDLQARHAGQIWDIVKLARQLGQAPAEFIWFGIEPFHVELDPALSEAMASRVADYANAIRAEFLEARPRSNDPSQNRNGDGGPTLFSM